MTPLMHLRRIRSLEEASADIPALAKQTVGLQEEMMGETSDA